jgi:hypothetical protein
MVYRLGKRAISQYIQTDCRRRLRLNLHSTAADRAAAAPERDAARPGFALISPGGTESRAAAIQLSAAKALYLILMGRFAVSRTKQDQRGNT